MKKRMGVHYRFYRLYYTLFAFITLVALLYYQATIPSPQVFRENLVTWLAGVLIGSAGLAIMMVCIRKYFLQLSGLQSLVENKPGNKLLITGIHRHVRHPLYAGTFMFIWGLFLVLPYWSLLIANFIITIYTVTGIYLEEKKLLEEFGEEYKDYRRRVPMLIPRF